MKKNMNDSLSVVLKCQYISILRISVTLIICGWRPLSKNFCRFEKRKTTPIIFTPGKISASFIVSVGVVLKQQWLWWCVRFSHYNKMLCEQSWINPEKKAKSFLKWRYLLIISTLFFFIQPLLFYNFSFRVMSGTCVH